MKQQTLTLVQSAVEELSSSESFGSDGAGDMSPCDFCKVSLFLCFRCLLLLLEPRTDLMQVEVAAYFVTGAIQKVVTHASLLFL